MDLPSDIAMSKTFHVTDLYEHHPTEQLYPDNNLRARSFEEEGTDLESQEKR